MVESSTTIKNSTNRLKDDELSFGHVELEVNRNLICEIAYVIKCCVKSIV